MDCRVMRATSGSYYVQRYEGFHWRKIGGFFHTIGGAKAFAREIKYGTSIPCKPPGVVAYV